MLGEEEDIEGKHTFDLQEKLETERFSQLFVQEMDGKGKICKHTFYINKGLIGF